MLDMGIELRTFKSKVFKKLALKYLCDIKQEVKDRIVTENDLRSGTPEA